MCHATTDILLLQQCSCMKMSHDICTRFWRYLYSNNKGMKTV